MDNKIALVVLFFLKPTLIEHLTYIVLPIPGVDKMDVSSFILLAAGLFFVNG